MDYTLQNINIQNMGENIPQAVLGNWKSPSSSRPSGLCEPLKIRDYWLQVSAPCPELLQ